MNLETFFEQFDKLADAPNAVANMRELVLQWAVQGRLVRQDPNDEPASKLIRDAVQARKELVAAKVVRAETADLGFLDLIGNGLPDGWVHAPLSVYVAVIMGQSPPSTTYNGSGEGLPFYQGKSQFGRLYPTATSWCTEPTKVGEPGDVIISVRAPVGPTNMLRERSCIGRGVTSLRSFGGDPMHLLYTLRAFERSIAAMGVGSTFVAISKSDLDDFRIPIPPLAEQKRIVAKVDELMALCDRLQAQQQERETRHAALARASLSRFADAPSPANLQFLFHPSYTIAPAELRKSILSLAVYGKLATREPDDDTIHSIEEFREAAASLAGSLDLRSPSASLDVTEPPFDVPAHWRWMALADLGAAQTGTTPSKNDPEAFNGDIPFIKPADIFSGSVNYSNESLTRFGAERGSRLAPAGSVLMVCIGTIGKCNMIERECAFNQQINSLTPVQWVDSRYLLLAVRAPYFQEVAWKKSSSTTIAIVNKGKWLSIPVPIPPLAEQRRVVAKVEHLMALVDQLEAQLAASQRIGTDVMQAVVTELTAGA